MSHDRPILQWVLNRVEDDPRVRRIGTTLRDAGYGVAFVGISAEGKATGPVLTPAEPIDGVPRYLARLPALPPLRGLSQAIDPRVGPRAWGERARWLARLGMAVREMFALDPVLVHAHDLDAFRLVAHLSARHGVPVVYDSHELERGRNAPQWSRARLALHGWSERATIARASAVVTVAPSIADVLRESHGIAQPTVVLNTHPRAHVRPNSPLRERLGLAVDARVIVYVGGVTDGRGLPGLLHAMNALPANVHLAIYGGVQRAWEREWRALVDGMGQARARIHVMGSVPYADVIHEIAGADVGFNAIELRCESYAHALPNKFFEYAFANVPLLSTLSASATPLIHAWGLGRTVSDGDEPALLEALRAMTAHEPARLSPERHRAFVDEFCWETQAERLLALYQRLIGPPARERKR